jgi:aspartyl-tRNA(Asn)/glutamyl-tRNA(Gln) amidotransferase subunit C
MDSAQETIAAVAPFGAAAPDASHGVDAGTVRRIAHLARIAVPEADVEHLRGEINAILAFVEQLESVDVSAVEPMTSVAPMKLKQRDDIVTDGGIADQVTANAPLSEDHFFLVPKVVE